MKHSEPVASSHAVGKGPLVIVARTEKEHEARSLVEDLQATGAQAWIVRQQQISGFDVY